MKKLYVYADFDWLQEPLLVGELSYESLRGNDSYGFKYDKDWLRKYGSLFLSDDLTTIQVCNIQNLIETSSVALPMLCLTDGDVLC